MRLRLDGNIMFHATSFIQLTASCKHAFRLSTIDKNQITPEEYLGNFYRLIILLRQSTRTITYLTPFRHLIPHPAGQGVRVSPFIYLTCNSYLWFETDYSLVP
jgi:hypothetical protein